MLNKNQIIERVVNVVEIPSCFTRREDKSLIVERLIDNYLKSHRTLEELQEVLDSGLAEVPYKYGTGSYLILDFLAGCSDIIVKKVLGDNSPRAIAEILKLKMPKCIFKNADLNALSEKLKTFVNSPIAYKSDRRQYKKWRRLNGLL